MWNKISVVVTTKNRFDFLKQSIESIKNQTIQPYEVLISDNHSSPPIPEYDIKKIYPDAKLIRPPTELPIDEHWIWALRQATGDWIAFLEDDNLWRQNHLEELVKAIEIDKNSALVSTAAIYFNNVYSQLYKPLLAPLFSIDLLKLNPVLIPSLPAIFSIFLNYGPAASAIAINKKILDSTNLISLGIKGPQDSWLWIQLLSSGYNFVFNPQITVLYRLHEEQISSKFNSWSYRKEYLKFVIAVRDLLKKINISEYNLFIEAKKYFNEDSWKKIEFNFVFNFGYSKWLKYSYLWDQSFCDLMKHFFYLKTTIVNYIFSAKI